MSLCFIGLAYNITSICPRQNASARTYSAPNRTSTARCLHSSTNQIRTEDWEGTLRMTRRRNIRHVQVSRRYGVLYVRERLRIQRLLQVVMKFVRLAESHARGNWAQRRERHDAVLITAIVCNIWQDQTRLGPSVSTAVTALPQYHRD